MYPRRLVRRVDQPALRQEAYVDTGRYPFLAFRYRLAWPELFIGMPGSGDHTFMYAFVAYRILGGIGVGLASMVSPMYIAEVLRPIAGGIWWHGTSLPLSLVCWWYIS